MKRTQLKQIIREEITKLLEARYNKVGKFKVAKMDSVGAYIIYDGKNLFFSPMYSDGSPEFAMEGGKLVLELNEVTHPHDQKFLDEVNKTFGTKFTMNDFDSR